jgi:hypothetical protein
MQKTAMLMQVITQAAPHLSLLIVLLCSAIMPMRLTIICMSSWISSTQRAKIENKTGTLSIRTLDSYPQAKKKKKEEEKTLQVTGLLINSRWR